MKITISMISILCMTLTSFGQLLNEKFITLSNTNSKLVSPSEKKFFEMIILKRSEVDLLKRIDTTDFDYLFIEEFYCTKDTQSYISERYFRENDSIPFFYLTNGDSVMISGFYTDFPLGTPRAYSDQYKLKPLLTFYSDIKPIQELKYRNTVFIGTAYDNKLNKESLIKNASDRYKKTYQILTMINKKTKEVITSFQLPAKHPQLSVEVYNDLWGW